MNTITYKDCVAANNPDNVVASPYDGHKNGSIVIINTPNPNPHTRCTNAAPALSSINIKTIVEDMFPFLWQKYTIKKANHTVIKLE